MTKYYKANVELRQFVEVEVAAESESEARRKAKDAAVQLVPGADAWTIELKLVGEAHFDVGSRVVHAMFGPGEITSLTRTTGPSKELAFRATVQLDSGDSKDFHLPHESIKPEGLGA